MEKSCWLKHYFVFTASYLAFISTCVNFSPTFNLEWNVNKIQRRHFSFFSLSLLNDISHVYDQISLRGGFLKIISVRILTYAGMKTGF